MNKYEMMFIVSPEVAEAEAKKVVESIKTEIEKVKGKVESVDEWGKRKFAYKIKRFTEGYYYLLTFELDPTKLKETQNNVKLLNNVVRYLVVKL